MLQGFKTKNQLPASTAALLDLTTTVSLLAI